MKSFAVQRDKLRLDRAFSQVGKLSADPELLSHWAKYLCVLVSGFIEVSVRTLYAEYARKKAAPKVANFVEVKLKRFHNPKMEEIQQLARSFSIEWEEAIKKTPEEARTAVNSIVANRHRIAHGEDVGLTVGMIRGYYQAAVTVVSLIDQQCDS